MPATRDDLRKLALPFLSGDIEWRIQTSGEKNGKLWARVLAYVTNRAIMYRLDEVVGPENWQNVYREGPAGGVVCGLSIFVARGEGAGEWVTKWDGAENSDIEAVKGGLSNAMKRAAVQWGIGRLLYELEEGWANVHEAGRFSAKTKDGKWFKWDPPALPEWALSPEERPADRRRVVRVNLLLGEVRDPKLAENINKRVAAGLTQAQANEAIKFLEAHLAATAEMAKQGGAPASAQPPASGEARRGPRAPGRQAASAVAEAADVADCTANADEGSPAAAVEAPAPPEPQPRCPLCVGAMIDERPRKQAGQIKENAPDWRCAAAATCNGKLWPGEWPPRKKPMPETFPARFPVKELRGQPVRGCSPLALAAALQAVQEKGTSPSWVDWLSELLEEQRAIAEVTAPTPAPARPSGEVPPGGRVADALQLPTRPDVLGARQRAAAADPDSVWALGQRLGELWRHPKLSPGFVSESKRLAVNGKLLTSEALHAEIERVERTIALPF